MMKFVRRLTKLMSLLCINQCCCCFWNGTNWKLIITTMSLLLFVVLAYFNRNLQSDYSKYYSLLKPMNRSCLIPKLDPYDPSILEYLPTSRHQLKCRRFQPRLTQLLFNGTLVINYTELTRTIGNNWQRQSLQCHYRCFDRGDADDFQIVYDSWIEFEKSAEPNCEFMEVKCTYKYFPIYSNLHNQILAINFAANGTGITSANAKSQPPSVILFVLDSVSKSNFRRSLPITLETLQSLYNATIFDGFHKIGDNSLPNAMAFMTGRPFSVSNWPSDFDTNRVNLYADDLPLIWNVFKQQGYKTFYSEDFPDYNLWHYLSNGFKRKPVDHYMRPFWRRLYGDRVYKMSDHLCYGDNKLHQISLNYLEQFIRKYHNIGQPVFALNWLTELEHNWLGHIAVADIDLNAFFRSIHPYVKDSYVFVFSDHGHRFASIRRSVVGRIEERMPFFAMAAPSASQIIRQNTQVLTTFWDLYVTLMDILSTWNTTDAKQFLAQPDWASSASRWGLSMLRPIPERTCEQVGIPDEFCTCQMETDADINDDKVQLAATKVIKKLNELLQAATGKCIQLSLANITNAQMFLPNKKVTMDDRVSTLLTRGHRPNGFFIDYRVQILTEPGRALFEAVVRHMLDGDDTMEVVGEISRINRYANQSHCVTNALLKKICYCF